MNISINLNRKPEDYRLDNCAVDVVEEVSHEQFEAFQNHPTACYEAISNNLNKLSEDTKNVRHCILMLDQDSNDGFLVNPHGSDYARYSAFIPNARQIYRINQFSSLAKFNDRMNRMVDLFLPEAVKGQKYGSYKLDISDIESHCDYEAFDRDLFAEMISERPEIIKVEVDNDYLNLTINPEYITSVPRELSQKEIDLICAKHVLWLYDEGGERANLSNCVLRNLNLNGKDLSFSVCCSAVFENCDLHSTTFEKTDIDNSEFLDCNMQDIYLERTKLVNTVLENCNISDSIINDSRLTNTVMRDCNLDNTNPKGCDLEGFQCVEGDITEEPEGLSPIL